MKRLIPGLALLLCAGCANRGVPTIEIGGSNGTRLMNNKAQDEAEAYEILFTGLTKQNIDVRLSLESQKKKRNLFSAGKAMRNILTRITRMRSLVTPESQADFDPYIAKYSKWAKSLEKKSWSGSLTSLFNRAEKEVRSRFHPSKVAIAVGASAPVTEEQPTVQPSKGTKGKATPPGSGEVPAGLAEASAGLAEVPAGLAELPAGSPPPPKAAPKKSASGVSATG